MVENNLASFWKPAISRAFAAVGTEHLKASGPASTLRKGHRTPREDLVADVRAMREAGYSSKQIADAKGLPRSTVVDLVKKG